MGLNGEDPGPLGVDGHVVAVHPAGKSIAVNRNNSSARELYDLEGNLIRGLTTDPVSDFSPDGKSMLIAPYRPLADGETIPQRELAIQDLETDEVTRIGVDGGGGLFTPDGKKIIFNRSWRPGFGQIAYGIFSVNVDGSGERTLIDGHETGQVVFAQSISPNGSKILYDVSYGNELRTMDINGSDSALVKDAGPGASYHAPTFSPDGSKIIAGKHIHADGGGWADSSGVYLMDIAGGGERALATKGDGTIGSSNWRPHWLPVPNTLDLKLETRRVDDGDDTFDVVMRLRAGNESAVENLSFTDPTIIESSAAGFPEDERSEVVKISGPDKPIPNRLEVNQESTHVWTYQVTKPGRVALYSEVTGRAVKDGVDETDGATVIAETIADGTEPDPAVSPQFLTMGAFDHYLMKAAESWLADNEAEARRIVKWAKKKLSPQQRKIWLGAKNKIKVSASEAAFADRFNIGPDLAAVLLPDKGLVTKPLLKKAFPSETKMVEAFWKGYKQELLQIGKRRLKGAWEKGGQKLKDGWLGSVAMVNYLNGDASPEERAQIEAMALSAWDDSITEEGWLEARVRRCLCASFPWANAVADSPLRDLTAEDVNSLYNDVTLNSQDLQAQLAQEEIALKNIYKNNNFEKALQKHGAQVANQTYQPLETTAGVLVGGGTEKLLGKVVKKAQGIVRIGKGTETINAKGTVPKGKAAVKNDPEGVTGARPSPHDVAEARRAGDPSDTVMHYENIGGIPLNEAQRQSEMIERVELELGLPEGSIGLGLKESSPYRKPNSVAKYELAKVKTGKPEHVQLGLDPRALSEPSFFKPKNPNKLPEWDSLSPTQQADLKKTYEKSWKEYKDWTSGNPSDPDLAKLSKATQRVGGPKITEPVTIRIGNEDGSGIQRTIKAIFEEVPVKGTDTIRIRARYYEADGIVFLDAKKARPMGPDLDAVAIYDARTGKRFADRQLENKIVRAYRKEVAADAKKGVKNHGAEHGMTMIMDDVPAGPNGSVGTLMQHGIPYLPEAAARAFAKRIEKFIEMTADEMLAQVDQFGKKLVVVTSKEVYYGNLPLDQW